jgi:hypothetical protein
LDQPVATYQPSLWTYLPTGPYRDAGELWAGRAPCDGEHDLTRMRRLGIHEGLRFGTEST